MSFKGENKKGTQRKSPPHLKRFAFVLIALLIFSLLAAFFVGRTVARGSSETLRENFYLFLSDSPFAFLVSPLFGDNLPDVSMKLPEASLSSEDGITVSFRGDSSPLSPITDTESDAKLFALKDPSRLLLARSSQGSNSIGSILSLSGGNFAFSAFTASNDRILVFDGEETENPDGEFFGITKEGILAFGNYSEYKNSKGDLAFASSANVHSLIVASAPTDFSPSNRQIGSPSFAIGQCKDGSLILGFFPKEATVSEISKTFYRLSAVNAAIVYLGDDTGYVFAGGESHSYAEGFKNAEFSSAWVIK